MTRTRRPRRDPVQVALRRATAAWDRLMACHSPGHPPVRDTGRHRRLLAAYTTAASRHLDRVDEARHQ